MRSLTQQVRMVCKISVYLYIYVYIIGCIKIIYYRKLLHIDKKKIMKYLINLTNHNIKY